MEALQDCQIDQLISNIMPLSPDSKTISSVRTNARALWQSRAQTDLFGAFADPAGWHQSPQSSCKAGSGGGSSAGKRKASQAQQVWSGEMTAECRSVFDARKPDGTKVYKTYRDMMWGITAKTYAKDFTRNALRREAKEQGRTPAPIDWSQGRHKELYESMRGEMERIKTCPLCRCRLTAIRERMSTANELIRGVRSTNITLDRIDPAAEGGTYEILSKLMAMCCGCNLVKSKYSLSEAKKRVALLKKNRNAATLDAEGFLIRPALAKRFEPNATDRKILLARIKRVIQHMEENVEDYNKRPLSIKLGRVRRVDVNAEEALHVLLPFLIDVDHFMDITGLPSSLDELTFDRIAQDGDYEPPNMRPMS